ncbi:MAG: hypothetical protein UHD07_03520 [Ruminobacter sp.]|nr:hypothetical protein [Ruminobacter sp.]
MVQLNNNGSDKNNSNIAFILIPVLFILVILGGLGLGIYLIITSFTSLENKNTDANEITTQSVTVVTDSNTKESSLEKTSLKSEITKDFNDTDKTNDKKEVKEIIQPSKIESNEVVANETEAKEVVANETEAKEIVVNETEANEVVANETETNEVAVNETEVKEVVANETETNEVVVNETEAKEVVTNETEFNDNALVQENVDNNFSEPNEELKDSKIEPSIEEKNSSPKIVEEEVLVQSEEQLATAKDNEQLKPTITIDTNIETDVRFDVGAIARARNVEEYKQQRSVSQKFEEKRKIMEERRKKIEEQRNKFEEKRRQYQSKNNRLFTYKELNQMVDLLKSVSANKKYNDDIIILDVRKDAGISYVYTYLVQGRTLNEFLRYERKQREALITKKTCERIKQDLGVSQKLKRLSYMAHEFIDPHQRTIAYVVVSKKSCNLD